MSAVGAAWTAHAATQQYDAMPWAHAGDGVPRAPDVGHEQPNAGPRSGDAADDPDAAPYEPADDAAGASRRNGEPCDASGTSVRSSIISSFFLPLFSNFAITLYIWFYIILPLLLLLYETFSLIIHNFGKLFNYV